MHLSSMMSNISGDLSKTGQMEMGRSDPSFHYGIELYSFNYTRNECAIVLCSLFELKIKVIKLQKKAKYWTMLVIL